MQSAWRVIDCSQMEGKLSYVRGHLRATTKEGIQQDIALAQTAVVLVGLHVQLSTGLLHQCAAYGVSVMVCDWKYVPVAAFHPWCETLTYVTARQRAQVEMSEPRRKAAWAQVVRAKVRGQAAVLDALEIEGGGLLRAWAKEIRSGDPSNIEGRAAREYWASLFGRREGFRRTPGEGSGRNAHFDYAYMVLRGFATKSVISSGLNPTLGINHHGRGNYFCLVDDLIEPFRPAVDYSVAQLACEAEMSPEVKRQLVGAVNQQFDATGHTIPSALTDFAQQFGLYCEKKVDRLPAPVFGVCDEVG